MKGSPFCCGRDSRLALFQLVTAVDDAATQSGLTNANSSRSLKHQAKAPQSHLGLLRQYAVQQRRLLVYAVQWCQGSYLEKYHHHLRLLHHTHRCKSHHLLHNTQRCKSCSRTTSLAEWARLNGKRQLETSAAIRQHRQASR